MERVRKVSDLADDLAVFQAGQEFGKSGFETKVRKGVRALLKKQT